jgi:nicotinate-nucleotide pyrophosphorylase (carboxylating)
MTFSPAEAEACRQLIALALAEDLGGIGDRTCQATLPTGLKGQASFVVRCPGVLAGLPAAALVLARVDASLSFAPVVEDGTTCRAGMVVARAGGSMSALLTAERTALNFLQHLSGIATLTRRFVDAVAGLPVKILDTRKTTPGWRLLEKYAVRCGGGHNHRMGLHDGILIKDNHLAALAREMGHGPGNITRVVRQARDQCGSSLPLEIEVDTLEQLDEALHCQPDMVLLDNMTNEQMRTAVRRRDDLAPGVLLEASGGVTLATVRNIAETGVDRISVGALTHSAGALDIALDYY